MNDESKDGKEQSKMSLAARKAWETRRKRLGYVEKPSSKDGPEVVVEQLKRRYRGSRSKDKQLRKAYRKGFLVEKNSREQQKSSVKMTKELWTFLYGSKYIEEVVLRKMYNVAVKAAKELIFEKGVDVEVPMAMTK